MKPIITRNWVFNGLMLLCGILQYFFPELNGDQGPQLAIWPALIAAGAAIGSSLIGKASADSERDAATQQYMDAVRYFESIGVPSVEAQKLVMQEYQNQGMLTPEMEQAFQQTGNAYDDIQLTPQYKEASLDALNSLRGIADSGGQTLTDKANIQRLLSEVGQADRGRREAIMSRLGARGQLGSGLELSGQLQNAQDASTQANQNALTIAGQQQDRALEAIRQGGLMGQQMNQQEFGQQSQIAQARNAINQFNTNAQQQVANRNVNRNNSAQEYNLTNKQRISDSNTDLHNKEQQYNKELLQKQFDNQMKKATGMANARQGLASNYSDNADRTAGMWAGIGDAASKAGTAIGQNQNSDDMLKKMQQMFGSGMSFMGNSGSSGG